MANPLQLVVVDDQSLVRAGLTKLLEAEDDLQVVGEAEDGIRAVELVEHRRPDVVLMDIRMPRLDGITATRRITAAGSSSRVLILTTYDLDEYVFEALVAGASGFLLKDAPPEQLVAAVRAVARGDALLDSSITRRLIEEFVRRKPDAGLVERLDALSGRELEVLRILGRGSSNAEISAALNLGAATVKTHVSNVLAKLSLRDRVQAVVFAYESGLVTPGDAGDI